MEQRTLVRDILSCDDPCSTIVLVLISCDETTYMFQVSFIEHFVCTCTALFGSKLNVMLCSARPILKDSPPGPIGSFCSLLIQPAPIPPISSFSAVHFFSLFHGNFFGITCQRASWRNAEVQVQIYKQIMNFHVKKKHTKDSLFNFNNKVFTLTSQFCIRYQILNISLNVINYNYKVKL